MPDQFAQHFIEARELDDCPSDQLFLGKTNMWFKALVWPQLHWRRLLPYNLRWLIIL